MFRVFAHFMIFVLLIYIYIFAECTLAHICSSCGITRLVTPQTPINPQRPQPNPQPNPQPTPHIPNPTALISPNRLPAIPIFTYQRICIPLFMIFSITLFVFILFCTKTPNPIIIYNSKIYLIIMYNNVFVRSLVN